MVLIAKKINNKFSTKLIYKLFMLELSGWVGRWGGGGGE